MALTNAVISTIVERLGDLLTEEVKLLRGVPSEVRHISQQLRWMQSFLEDADDKQNGEKMAKTIRSWIADVRQLAYDVEDVLESYIQGVECNKKGGIKKILRRCIRILNEIVSLHNIGSEIKDIKARISKLDTLRQSYDIRAITEGEGRSSVFMRERERELRRSYSHIDDEDFVGMEGDIKLLVKLVVNDDVESENFHRALFICGMGGLGKTTLARKIYNHEDVRSHFNAFAWVCISEQWKTRDVLLGILTKLIPDDKRQIQEIVTWSDELLIKKIFRVQQERKCFLVLDDIWSKEAWDCVKAAFSTRKSGSKLLLTSRNEQVLRHVDSQGFLHEPKPLDDEHSWKLLEKKAFIQRASPGIDDIPKKQELGKEMVKSCKGVPLAIIVLGGILVTKQTSIEWMMVQKNIKSCIASGEGMEERHEGVQWILKLSYSELSYRLKPCYVYLAKFPEDTEIDTESLYQLWMAENMLAKEDKRVNESWMDVAERYLDQLAYRNMVMVESNNEKYWSFRRYRSCRLHDLMRDLCVFQAKEEDFFEAINFEHLSVEESSSSSSYLLNSSTRRLVLYFGEKYSARNCVFPTNQGKCGRLRSLLIFFQGHAMSAVVMRDYVKDFKFLRVLLLEGLNASLSGHGDFGIFELIHLRYLSLKGSNIDILPSSIANMEYLETLDLRVRGRITWLSSTVLQKMRKLIHLYLPLRVDRNGEMAKVRLDRLLKLETIRNFNPKWCDISDLFNQTNLQNILNLTLSEDLEDLDRFVNNLQSNNQLRFSDFKIRNYDFDSERGTSILSKLLRCGRVNSLVVDRCVIPRLGGDQEVHDLGPNLLWLYIGKNNLIDYKNLMDTLGKLPQLQSLFIQGGGFPGEDMVWSATSFPQLRRLSLWSLPELRMLTVEEGAMPCLAYLDIGGCKSLEMFPDGLRLLKSLREMVVSGMPESVMGRVRVGGEDFDKVRHVPAIHVIEPETDE